MKTGPNIVTTGLVFALDGYSNIRGFTKFGTSDTNNSHRAIRNLVDKSTTYSLSDTSQLTGGNYFTLYALTYPESSQTPASRHGITAGFNNTSATKLYSHSRDLGYYVFDESTNNWVANSYFNGERIDGHVYDTYDGEPDQHQKFQDDYDVIKQFFPNATHIVIGSHASENIDNDADTVTRLKEIGLPDDAVGLGRVEFVLAGKVNKPHTHHYVRENVSSTVAHMNLRLPLEGLGGSMIFDGTDDYLTIAGSTDITSDVKTIEIAFKMNGSYSNMSPLAVYANGSSATNRIWLGLQSNKFKMHGWGTDDPSGTTTISADEYYICTFSYNKSTQAMKMYTNGVLESSTTNSQGGVTAASNMNWYIGTVPGGWQSVTYSNVDVPIFKIYNRILSDSEVKQNFNAYRKRFGI